MASRAKDDHTRWGASLVEIFALGTFEVRFRDQLIVPTAAKPRQLLAMLAMHANDVVSIDLLYQELWGDRVPRTASTTLQTYISQLRKLIRRSLTDLSTAGSREPKRVLITTARGYLLNAEHGRPDYTAFDAMAAAGHQARETRDFVAASRYFHRALTLWRGPALSDVTTGALLAAEVCRLSEARRNVLDRRIDADLRIGRHHQLVSELVGLTVGNPTHEGLHMQLMVALSRCGRRSEAMNVYRRLHTHLREDTGLEPSDETKNLLRSILSAGERGTELVDHSVSLRRTG